MSTTAVTTAPVTTAGSRPAVARATSSGTFRGAVFVANVVSPSVALPSAVAVGDVTGDGLADLVVTTVNRDNVNGGTTIAVYPRQANGKLGAPFHVKTKDVDDIGTRITLADLYGTGHREIILAEGSTVDVFAVSGSKITGPTRVPAPAIDLAVADVNGDGHPDLVITTGDHQTTEVYTGSAAHTFHLWRTETFPVGSGPAWTSVFAADLNGDGAGDIVLDNGTSAGVRLQTAPGTFGAARMYANAPIGGQVTPPAEIAVGDVTGDGRPDVVTDAPSNTPYAGVEVFAANSDGTLKAPVVYSTLDIPEAMTIADLNGDGRGDLVVEHASWNNVGVMLQRSNGTFAAESLYPVTDCCDNGPDEAGVGDLNGDGRPDIAVNAGQAGIAIFYGK